jgi:uncharacterized protein YecE (DUF72 family)
MDIQVGCCGFPKARKEYYKVFGVVEVQQTFYQPPALKTAQKWREEAPANFEFTLKAWQLITHEPKSPTYRRLKLHWPADKLARCGSFKATEEVAWAWEETREIANALHAKYVVFQCPASFHPSAENKRNLDTFFRKVKRKNFRFIWEPRGAWKSGEIYDLCRELDLIHGVDPFKADPQWGRVRYFRLHGITGYRYRFSVEDLKRLREKCRGMTYCFFNNVNMWADASAFQDQAQESGTKSLKPDSWYLKGR